MLSFAFSRLALRQVVLQKSYDGLGSWRTLQKLPKTLNYKVGGPVAPNFAWAPVTPVLSLTAATPITYRYGFSRLVWPLKEEGRLRALELAYATQWVAEPQTPGPLLLDRKGLAKKTAANTGLWFRTSAAAPLLGLSFAPSLSVATAQVFLEKLIGEAVSPSAAADFAVAGSGHALAALGREANPEAIEPLELSPKRRPRPGRIQATLELTPPALLSNNAAALSRAFALTAL